MKHTDKLYLIKLAAQQVKEPSMWSNLAGYAPHVTTQLSALGSIMGDGYKSVKDTITNSNLSGKQWLDIGDKFVSDVGDSATGMLADTGKQIRNFSSDAAAGFQQMYEHPSESFNAVKGVASTKYQQAKEDPLKFMNAAAHDSLRTVGLFGKGAPSLIANTANAALYGANALTYAAQGKYDKASGALFGAAIAPIRLKNLTKSIGTTNKGLAAHKSFKLTSPKPIQTPAATIPLSAKPPPLPAAHKSFKLTSPKPIQ